MAKAPHMTATVEFDPTGDIQPAGTVVQPDKKQVPATTDDAKFKFGDVVVSKVGGPVMTISDVIKGSDRFGYRTSWLIEDEEQTGTFPENMLELFD